MLRVWRPTLLPENAWETANGVAKRIVRFGGGKRSMERALQNQFWRAPKVGFVWSVRVPSKENDIE